MSRPLIAAIVTLLALLQPGCPLLSDGDADDDPCAPDPCAGMVGRECRAGRCVAGALVVEGRGADGVLGGTWRPVAGGPEVTFRAAADGAERATAAFLWPDGTTVITSVDGDVAEVRVGVAVDDAVGLAVDGYGPPTAEEQQALDALRALPGETLALVPLDLACAGTDLAPAELAALLLPWQTLLKYTPDRGAVIRETAAASACGYFPAVTGNGGGNGGGDGGGDGAAAAPAPELLRLSNDSPIPDVFGFFPFDAEGALEPKSQLTGPCGALCRGTCGADCTGNNCEKVVEWRCDTDAAGQKTGVKDLWTVYTCGTALGCRKHDQCYDGCNDGRCDSWSAAVCRRGCDVEACLEFGVTTCQSWARGYGPYDGELTYEFRWDAPMTDESLCGAGQAVDAGTTDATGPAGGDTTTADPPVDPALDPEIFAACLSACARYNALCEEPADCDYGCTSEQTSWTLDKPCALDAHACRAAAATCRELLGCPSAILSCSR